MPRQKPLVRDLLTDPGMGYAVCNIIYASKANDVALGAAFACALMIVLLRAARLHIPPTGAWRRRLHDEGLSLRLLGIVIVAASLYTLGAAQLGFSDSPAHYRFALLQGMAGLLFGTGNLLLARSLDGRRIARSLRGTLLQPETWMAAGMLCLGLIAGPLALLALPFVVAGYALALRGLYRGRPEWHNHPKLYYAAATLVFAAVAADPWIVAANVLNALCLVTIEHRLTPGGLWRLLPAPHLLSRESRI